MFGKLDDSLLEKRTDNYSVHRLGHLLQTGNSLVKTGFTILVKSQHRNLHSIAFPLLFCPTNAIFHRTPVISRTEIRNQRHQMARLFHCQWTCYQVRFIPHLLHDFLHSPDIFFRYASTVMNHSVDGTDRYICHAGNVGKTYVFVFLHSTSQRHVCANTHLLKKKTRYRAHFNKKHSWFHCKEGIYSWIIQMDFFF